MRADPAEGGLGAVAWPPSSVPGSGKDAWRAFASRVADANSGLAALVQEQSNVIALLKAELALIRQRLDALSPPGGSPRVSDATAARIEAALAEGLSTRAIGKRFGVSAMTVSRMRKRMNARGALMCNE